MLIGRLILLSKSNSPVTKIDKTRPIAIQSIPVRIKPFRFNWKL